MPEIKNTFMSGKMNKDLDERLVPNGEYRDAMNIQLSTSDSSDVGALENILGNKALMAGDELGDSSYCVGTVADEKNNALYWLVAGPVYAGLNDTMSRDIIYEYKDGNITPVVVDIYRIRTSYGNHDSTANTLLVKTLDSNGNPYPGVDLIEVGMVAQFDDALAQMSYFGNNPVTAVSAPDPLGNITITLQNSFNVPALPGSNSQASSFIFSHPDGQRVLNFQPGRLITGINILNDFLFFTDNFSEPKKINIPRCKEGTQGINTQTRLIVPDRNVGISNNIRLQEKHVTLIKTSPHTPLLVKPKFQTPTLAQADVDFALPDSTGNDVLVEIGDGFIVQFYNFDSGYQYEAGDEIRFLNGAGELPEDHQVRAIVKANVGNQMIPSTSPPVFYPNNTYIIEIASVAGDTPTTQVTYNVAQVPGQEPLFEKKFPRFSYRYKYQDGEYSTFAPFTDVIFSADSFDYDSKVAYNKGMQNYIESLELRNFKPHNLPEDVVQVDLLYKETNSTTIYVVDKIKANDTNGNITLNGTPGFSNWDANMFKVTSDLIYSVVPSNQLLRPFDNVPRVALAQEITGNRVVFANYLQNFNLDIKPLLESDNVRRYDKNFTNDALVEYELNFGGNNTNSVTFNKVDYDYGDYRGLPTLKTMRNYQVGVTYLDAYGRETPVFSNPESTFYVPKKQAEGKSKIKTRVTTTPPDWSKGFKFYVKETANEYYNLAMDRVYRAEDGNLWLSFPSSERNKIDEDTFLYLKKQVDSNSVVPEQAKYKVIAIENEAPDFIKTEIKTAGESAPTATEALLQTSAPVVGSDYFEIDEDFWIAGNNAKLIEITDKLSLAFHKDGIYTKTYDVINLSYGSSSGVTGGGAYRITLDRAIDTDDQWIYPNYPTVSSNNLPDFGDNLSLKVYKHVMENKPEFEGKFFVKINGDAITETRLIGAVQSDVQFQVDARMNAYFLLDSNANFSNGNNTTGNTKTQDIEGWENALDFNNPEDDIVDSEWFIDGTYFPMYHKQSSGAKGTGFHLSEHNHKNNPDNTQNGGYGKGIQQDPSDPNRWYIELAFSKLKPDFSDEQPFEGSRIGNVASPGTINYAGMNENYVWEVGSATNQPHIGEAAIVQGMKVDGLFRFTGDTNPDPDYNTSSQIYKIVEVRKIRRYNHTRWGNRTKDTHPNYTFGPTHLHRTWKLAHDSDGDSPDNWYYLNPSWTNDSYADYEEYWRRFMRADNRRIVYRLYVEKNPRTASSFDPISAVDGGSEGADADTPIGIEFISPRTTETAPLVSDNPAIWETEPKENIDLNIFHEASQVYPTKLDASNNYLYVPKGSIVTFLNPNPNTSQALFKNYTSTDVDTTVLGWYDHNGDNQGDLIALSHEIDTTFISLNDTLKFTRHDNSYTTLNLADLTKVGTYPSSTYVYKVNTDVSQNEVGLSWYNAFSFSNGVESDRLRDDFNQVRLDKGPIVSTILDTMYKEERRSSGLIFSGIYNSNSGVNNLNQFIQAEKITKDINPTYGSIQKLFSRNTDLIALCEDRVIRIQANKDAIFNADGNPQLIASTNVLGQTMPFAGDYGISKNPESFAVDNYRAYFTDKQRSAVLRLSKDGLTPISDYGMSDWFGDNLQNYPKLVGSFDKDKGDYNITLRESNITFNNPPYTISYNEDVKGWTSFKSYIPEQGISMSNDYYTFQGGYIYKHHDEAIDRNTFYGVFMPSSINVLLNADPGSVKNYQTLNYEGSKSKIVREDVPAGINSNEYESYYNLVSKEGWFVDTITTNKQKGHVNEFKEKEGKWFNYIKGNTILTNADIKTSEFSFQGIGRASSVPTPVLGCMDSSALNYDPLATVDDGSCTYPTPGCCDQKANNYNPGGVCDNSLCTYDDTWNCDTINGGTILITDGTGTYSSFAQATASCPTCIGTTGCTDPLYLEYDASAVCDDGSCTTLIVDGCMDSTIGSPFFPDIFGNCADGVPSGTQNGHFKKCDPGNGYVACDYNPLANVNTGYCPPGFTEYGCTDLDALNYDPCAAIDDGTCTYDVYGCTDSTMFNYDPAANIDDGSCVPFIYGCTDINAANYDPAANTLDNSCCYVSGCTDPTMSNYNASACFDDGSCIAYTNDWANIDPCLGCQNYGEAYLLANYPYVMGFPSEHACGAYQYNFGSYGLYQWEYQDEQEWLDPCPCMLTIVNGVPLPLPAPCQPGGANYPCNTIPNPNYLTWYQQSSGGGPSGNGTNYYAQTVDPNTGSFVYTLNTCFLMRLDPIPSGTIASNVNPGTFLQTNSVHSACTVIDGCTDDTAQNYDPAANCDDGTCIPYVYGCNDPNAINYYPGATIDDGSCIYAGCTNPAADNYDPLSTIDDGSCCSSDPSTGLPACP